MDELRILQPLVEVRALVVHYGNVLLVKCDNQGATGKWALPATRLQWGQSMQLSIAREVLLMTGITIRAGAVIHAYDLIVHQTGTQMAGHRVVIEMEADYLTGELLLGEGVVDVAWVSDLALSSMEAEPSTLELLKEIGFIHAA